MTRLMRLTPFLFSFFVHALHVVAQEQPIHQPEKFIFYEVVNVDSSSRGLLYHNALTWVNHNQMSVLKKDSLEGIIQAEDEFSVYKETGLLKKLSGKVTYRVLIESKDNRYRYHFYDFIFHGYTTDRYHNSIPSGSKKNLEERKAPGWQKLWDDHREKSTTRMQQTIASLKIKIIEKPLPPKQTQVTEPKKEVKWD